MDVPQQMRRSLSVDLARGNNSMGLPQPFPPRGMPLQQHNIMGQPFIELRHRAPENRMRLPFVPPTVAGNVVDPSLQPQRLGFVGGQEMGFPGPRIVDSMLSQSSGVSSHMPVSSSMENSPQHSMPSNVGPPQSPLMRSLSQTTASEPFNMGPSLLPLTPTDQPEDIPVANTDGIEEKLDTDDSAVKDLEDVEVKDLDDEDLENLNFDPDGSKDLDLETNDLHLDDFLTSGKFDIIAYTDPELDLGDKKDIIFNEDLDLGDPIDDHGNNSDLQKPMLVKNANSTGTTCSSQIVPESAGEKNQQDHIEQKGTSPNKNSNPLPAEQKIKTEVREGLTNTQDSFSCRGLTDEKITNNQEVTGSDQSLPEASAQPAADQVAQPCDIDDPGPNPVLSSLLVEEKLGDADVVPGASPSQSGQTAQARRVAGMQQNPSMLMAPRQIQELGVNPNQPVGHRVDSSAMAGVPMCDPDFLQGPSACSNYRPTGPQGDQDLPMPLQALPHNLAQAQQQPVFPQALNQQNQQNRPLLLDEQPLLLQDLLDQERQEQQQQRQMQAMIRQRSSDSFFPNIGNVKHHVS